MDYERQLRRLVEERQQTISDGHETKARFANLYEDEDDDAVEEGGEEDNENQHYQDNSEEDDDGNEYDDDDDDDISLDEMEMEAYMRLKMAKEQLAKRETMGQRIVATSIIPHNEPIQKDDKMLQKLDQIEISTAQPWMTYLSMSSTRALKLQNVENDLEREMQFYEHALNSAHDAVHRLREEGVPNERPDDYFAEMVKSDEHMHLVKDRLLKTRDELNKREERRRQKELKRFGKQIQIERMKQKLDEKKRNLERIRQWKKLAAKGVKENDIESLLNADDDIAAAVSDGVSRGGSGASAESVLEVIKERRRDKTQERMKRDPKFASMVEKSRSGAKGVYKRRTKNKSKVTQRKRHRK